MHPSIEKAWVLIELRRYDQATQLLGEVLAAEPDDVSALAALANIAQRQGDSRQALLHCLSALRLAPDNALLWRVRALAEIQLSESIDDPMSPPGRRESALLAARRAVEIDPEEADNHRILAVVQRVQDPVAALESLDRALAIDPDEMTAHFLRGVILRRDLDQPYEAELALYDALELEPDYADALLELGMLEMDHGAFDSAEEHLRQAARLDPRRSDSVRSMLDSVADLRDEERRRRSYSGEPGLLPPAVHLPGTGLEQPRAGMGLRIAAVIIALLVTVGIRGAMGEGSDGSGDRTRSTLTPPIPAWYLDPSNIRGIQPTYQRPVLPSNWPSLLQRPTYVPVRPSVASTLPPVTLPPGFSPYGG